MIAHLERNSYDPSLGEETARTSPLKLDKTHLITPHRRNITNEPVERYRIGLQLLGKPEGPILDIGCSIGILEQFVPSIGVDIHSTAIRGAKRAHPSAQFVLASAESLPFKTGSISAIIMLDTLEHVGNESETLAEASRVLKTDGSIVLSMPNNRFIYNLVDLEFWFFPITIGRPRHRHYDMVDIQRLLSSHNIRVETFLERGLVFSAMIQWVLLPFDVVDYSLFHSIRGPLGGRLRDVFVDRFVDKEFDIITTCGRTLFVRGKKTDGNLFSSG